MTNFLIANDKLKRILNNIRDNSNFEFPVYFNNPRKYLLGDYKNHWGNYSTTQYPFEDDVNIIAEYGNKYHKELSKKILEFRRVKGEIREKILNELKAINDIVGSDVLAMDEICLVEILKLKMQQEKDNSFTSIDTPSQYSSILFRLEQLSNYATIYLTPVNYMSELQAIKKDFSICSLESSAVSGISRFIGSLDTKRNYFSFKEREWIVRVVITNIVYVSTLIFICNFTDVTSHKIYVIIGGLILWVLGLVVFCNTVYFADKKVGFVFEFIGFIPGNTFSGNVVNPLEEMYNIPCRFPTVINGGSGESKRSSSYYVPLSTSIRICDDIRT